MPRLNLRVFDFTSFKEEEIPAYLKGLASSTGHMLNSCYPLALTGLQLWRLGRQNRGVTSCPKYLYDKSIDPAKHLGMRLACEQGHCSLKGQ